MKRTGTILAVLGLLLMACGPAATPTPAKPAPTPTPAEPILIGVISSLSGSLALPGTGGQQGTILAVEEINQKGGVLGRPLKLLMRDDKSLPEEGTKAFRELAAEGALVVVGNVSSAVSAGVSPLAKELKLPFFTIIGYSAFLTEQSGHRYFFRLITNDRVFGKPMAEFLAKQPYTKYCTIGNDFAYGHSITDGVMKRLKELKPEAQALPGCEFWVPMGATDFTANITAILAKKPEAVMFGGLVAASPSAFMKQAKAFGLFPAALGVHPSLGMPANNAGITNKEDLVEGVFTGSDYPYPPVDNPASKAFFDAYKKRWNQLTMETSLNAYTTVKFISQALAKAGRVDREALVDAAEGMSIEHPVLGKIAVRPFDHQSTAGWWMGYLTWDATNNRVGMKDTWYQPGDPYLPSQEEVQKLRAPK